MVVFIGRRQVRILLRLLCLLEKRDQYLTFDGLDLFKDLDKGELRTFINQVQDEHATSAAFDLNMRRNRKHEPEIH